MIGFIESQVVAALITSENKALIRELLQYDESYYNAFDNEIKFIRTHYNKTGKTPDRSTFLAEFPDTPIYEVNEPLSYFKDELRKNKKRIGFTEVFNKTKDLGENDIDAAVDFVMHKCRELNMLDDDNKPMDIVHDVELRKKQVQDYSRQTRIPTGFAEIDKAMYGGFSTVEELVLLEARTGTGKSWICTEITESAQNHGFNVAYYSPEMMACFIGTRFDTWRGHYANSQLFQGQYSDDYLKYTEELKKERASVFVIEDKDAPNNTVTVPFLEDFVKDNGIKLLIIDGLSYMTDHRAHKGDSDSVKYKNICEDLFRLSKQCGCAVVVVVQANRATKDNTKDEKGESFPNIYNIEGSDHPARIATQIFAVRQIFEKHILDIRLEKARNAQNQKPLFSYSWEINTGTLHYIPNNEELPTVSTPVVNSGFTAPDISGLNTTATVEDIGLDIDDNVEF